MMVDVNTFKCEEFQFHELNFGLVHQPCPR